MRHGWVRLQAIRGRPALSCGRQIFGFPTHSRFLTASIFMHLSTYLNELVLGLAAILHLGNYQENQRFLFPWTKKKKGERKTGFRIGNFFRNVHIYNSMKISESMHHVSDVNCNVHGNSLLSKAQVRSKILIVNER